MKKIVLFISTLILNLSLNAQIGSFDPAFNNGNFLSIGNYGSGQKIVALSNQESLIVNNFGISTPDFQNNTETGYLSTLSLNTNGVGTYNSFCELNSTDQFTSFTDFYRASDGKITVIGYKRENFQDYYANIVVGRFSSNGVFDPTFNGGNYYEYNQDFSNFNPKKVSVMSNGKIIVAGGINNSLFILCLNSNGTLDTSFGNNGSKSFYYMNGTGSLINDMTILSNDKILIAGYEVDADNNYKENGFVARLKSDGSTDSTFGINGVTKVLFGEAGKASIVSSIALTSTGKIIVAGYGYYVSSQPYDRPKGGVIRLSSDGVEDFLQPGIYVHTAMSYSVFNKVKMINQDEFIVAGEGGTVSDEAIFAFFDSDGNLKSSISNDGIVTFFGPFSSVNILDFDFQPDGKLIYSGSSATNTQRTTFVGRLLMSNSNNGGGTNEINELVKNRINVYPNPTKDQLTIQTQFPTKYKLTDIKGNLLIEKNIESTDSISISNLESGMYFIQSTEGEIIKLIKE